MLRYDKYIKAQHTMLTAQEEKFIRSLHTKKGRQKSGKCLVEGKKNIEEAKKYLDFIFTPQDSKNFAKLVSTTTPQDSAGVATIPTFSLSDIASRNTVILLDTVQDPGNVGSILRLCLGFDASLLLLRSADPTNPKTTRASTGALFKTPWMTVEPDDITQILAELNRPTFLLQKKKKSTMLTPDLAKKLPQKRILVMGSEGKGITVNLSGESIYIPHDKKLESLNVTHALAITLFLIQQ